MKRWQANVRVEMTVDFTDNGIDDVRDQAVERAKEMVLLIEDDEATFAVVGTPDSYSVPE